MATDPAEYANKQIENGFAWGESYIDLLAGKSKNPEFRRAAEQTKRLLALASKGIRDLEMFEDLVTEEEEEKKEDGKKKQISLPHTDIPTDRCYVRDDVPGCRADPRVTPCRSQCGIGPAPLLDEVSEFQYFFQKLVLGGDNDGNSDRTSSEANHSANDDNYDDSSNPPSVNEAQKEAPEEEPESEATTEPEPWEKALGEFQEESKGADESSTPEKQKKKASKKRGRKGSKSSKSSKGGEAA